MQINSISSGFGGLSSVSGAGAAAGAPAAGAGTSIANRADLYEAREQLFRVLEAFDELDRLVNGRSTILSGLPSARSDPALDLNLSATASSLGSVAQINATPTSFSPFVPDWDDGSSAFLTFGGAYDGSNGTGALSFEVRRAGVHGEDRLRIRIRDPDNNLLRNVTIRETHPIDRQYDIGNGMYFTLSEGSLINRDTTTVQVFDSVGSVVDPDKPFNGTGNDNPNFEYGLPGVVAGSFMLNGETIAVGADDTLTDVLNTINTSAAGVTAVFNPVTERIEMVQNTAGSSAGIEITGDDSNFVEATKLLDAVVVPGTDPDTTRALQSVSDFSEISSGEIIVNGEAIAIDAENDSLEDVLERINTAGVGAQASFDAGTQRVIITGDESGASLTIDDNGTGFFNALNVPEGRVDPRGRGNGYSRRQANRIASAMEAAVTTLNDFFRDTRGSGESSAQVSALRSQLESAFTNLFGSSDSRVDVGMGLSIDYDAIGKQYARFASLDKGALSQALQARGDVAKRFFNGSGDSPGLLKGVGNAAQGAFQSLNSTLGTRGTLFDAYA